MSPQPPACVVGILEQANHYQAALYEGVRAGLEPLGIPLLLVACDPFRPAPAPTLRWAMNAFAPAAIIRVPLADASEDVAVDAMLADHPGIRVLHLGQRVDGPCVHADNELGMRALVRHLIQDAGVRRPLVVRGHPHQQDSIIRERIVREELAAGGVPLDEDLVVTGSFRRDAAYEAVHAVVSRRKDFDAVIAFNDPSALGAMDAVTQAGLRIPQDVVITGFDNEELAELSDPPLTSVDQQLVEQGEQAARSLLRVLDGEPVGPLSVPTRLVVRESTGRGSTRVDGGAERRRALLGRLWNELGTLDTALSLNRSLLSTGTLGETVAALATSLNRIGARRAFLVLLDDAPDGTRAGRLVLSFKDGESTDTVAEHPFAPERLLPEHLRDELFSRTLALHPLSTEDAELGYVLLELTGADRFVSEALRLDVTRTLDRLRRMAELTRYTHDLEHLVAERTRELQLEVGVRRRQERELQRLNEELQVRLHQDGLTGICNRVGFDVELLAQWSVLSRAAAPLSLLMIDVDHFKKYNDAHGHLAGDECLKQVARALGEAVNRPHDTAARYGGEEFAVILPNTPSAGAVLVAERIHRALAAFAVPHPGSPQGVVTVSIGVATLHPGAFPDPAALIAEADSALYAAKAAGRNTSVVSEGGVLTG